MATRERLYDFEAEQVRETEKAILLDIDGKTVWFPKYVIEDHGDGCYTIPEKWAIEKEIV